MAAVALSGLVEEAIFVAPVKKRDSVFFGHRNRLAVPEKKHILKTNLLDAGIHP